MFNLKLIHFIPKSTTELAIVSVIPALLAWINLTDTL